MRFKCLNCGCINNFGIKQDNTMLLLQSFCRGSGALYCAIIDMHGFVLASEADKAINNMIKRKILKLYKSIADVKIIDFNHRIEMITLIEDFDVALKGFLMLMKEFSSKETLIAIIPPWLNIRNVLSDYRELLNKLSNYFTEQGHQDATQYISIEPEKVIKNGI